MERKLAEKLSAWKQKRDRMPLILHGARQVGKTFSILGFGKAYYHSTAYFNLEDSRALAAVFERDFDPERIVRELSVLGGISITKENTLIFFDEIQACERALTSLKYFAEQAPEYHVIAAGSLLGVALNRERSSFPVGKVELLNLYPLDFEEFLLACGQQNLIQLIRQSFQNNEPLSAHDLAMDFYKKYLVIGGMPAVVKSWLETQDFNYIVAVQKSLNGAYLADMAKYATPQETTRIMAVWDSIPGQLAKENHKFQYKFIRSGARAYEYELPLQWLKSAGMINRCDRVSEGKLPLTAYADHDAFKIYILDSGLLCAKFDLSARIVVDSPSSFDGFKGTLAENYIMQALVVNGFKPYYWRSPGKAELDFVFQDRQGDIIPLEAKSAENVRSRSLRNFIDLYKPSYALRVSAKNFGFSNGIRSVPLYALFCLET